MHEAELIRAAGAVVWRGSSADPEVTLVHRPRYDDWTLPKGKSLDAEPAPVTAVREVEEETGLTVVLGRPLPAQGYFRGDRPKRVDYWAAQVDVESAFVANDEVDKLAWLPVREALRRLSYPRDADTVRALATAPIATTPYVIVRHGQAGSSSKWRRDDGLRPLDADGIRQASMLAAVFACYRPGRLVSSPATRCLQTVQPYADVARIPVEPDPVFAVDAAWTAPTARMRGLLRAESPIVVCGHGESLPPLVTWSCVELGGAPPADSSLAKGAFWVLHAAKGTLVGLEQHTVSA